MFKLLKKSMRENEWKLFGLNCILLFFQVAADVLVPLFLIFLNNMINETTAITSNGWGKWVHSWNHQQNAYLITSIMILVGLIGMVIGIWRTFVSTKLSCNISMNIRNMMYAKVQLFSLADLDKISSASLITRITTDVTLVNNAYTFIFRTLLKSLAVYFGCIIAIIVIATQSSEAVKLDPLLIQSIKNANNLSDINWVQFPYNPFQHIISDNSLTDAQKLSMLKSAINYPTIPSWSIIVLVVLATIGLLVSVMGIALPATKHFMTTQKNVDNINSLLQQNVIGQRVVKSFNLQDQQINSFNVGTESLRSSSTRAGTILFMILPTIYFFLDIVIVLVSWLMPSSLLSSVSSVMMLINLMLVSMVLAIVAIVQIGRSYSSMKRINELLNYEPIIKYNDSNNVIESNSIRLENVSFKYGDDSKETKYALKNINLDIKPGEIIGIIGPTSSGKTTLINLITRMYDPTNGIVKLSDKNIKDIPKDELRNSISLCPQQITLFSGTIKSNLLFANQNATESEIDEASINANAYEFIMQKDNNYDSIVEERGSNFSGGQKQRIAIARTLLKKSKYLILDDSTSALDMLTEAQIQSKLFENPDKQTILVVAQRISAVKNANRIIVMDKGEIIAFDTHENLLKNCNNYYEIALSQLGEKGVRG